MQLGLVIQGDNKIKQKVIAGELYFNVLEKINDIEIQHMNNYNSNSHNSNYNSSHSNTSNNSNKSNFIIKSNITLYFSTPNNFTCW